MSVRKKDDTWFFNGETEPIKSDTHDVIVHSLNRWRDYKRGNTKRPVYFSVDNFSGTESEWEGLPVIFSNHGHPTVPFRVDPVKALESCQGEIVGAFHSAAVDTAGSPRFVGKVDFSTEDAEDKHQKGNLALSSGFYMAGNHDQLGRLQGKAIPDHILVFEADGPIKQQDPAAMFLNGATDDSPPKVTVGMRDLFEKFKEFMKGYFTNASGAMLLKDDSYDGKEEQVAVQVGYVPVMNASNDTDPRTGSGDRMTEIDATKQIEGLNATIAERDALLTARTQEVEAVKAKLTEFEKLQTDREAADLEAKWTELKTKVLLPGQVKKPEDEAKLKEMFLKDKDSFYLNAVINRPKPSATDREGAEFYGNAGSEEDAEVDALVNELRTRTGRRMTA